MATLKSLRYVCNETLKCLIEDWQRKIKMQVGADSFEELVKKCDSHEFFCQFACAKEAHYNEVGWTGPEALGLVSDW